MLKEEASLGITTALHAEQTVLKNCSGVMISGPIGGRGLKIQGGVTPIEPVQTLSTAVKILDRPK